MANFNINKVILGGRMTADVELKQTPSGVSVCSFSIAVNRKGKEAQTDFIECQAWRQTAEFIARYFRKGSSICIVGSIQKRTWKDQQGNNRYATEIVVDEALFVDSKGEGAYQEGQDFPKNYAPQDAQFEEIKTDDDLPF
ncbi:MAG: single-stranded DNA-binding protein [Clostridia bacterium]|nr:single-stranded DNA-binding protein [Clostridia bacterium]